MLLAARVGVDIDEVAGTDGAVVVAGDSRFAGRWTATDVQRADVVIRYGASDGYVAYEWRRGQSELFLRWTGSGQHTRLRLLLPPDAGSELQATLNGQRIEATVTASGTSRYLEVAAPASGILLVKW